MRLTNTQNRLQLKKLSIAIVRDINSIKGMSGGIGGDNDSHPKSEHNPCQTHTLFIC